MIDFVLGNLIVGRIDSDGGQHQLGPALLDQDAGEVVDMEPLHRDADETLAGIIEPAEGGEPAEIAGGERLEQQPDLAAAALPELRPQRDGLAVGSQLGGPGRGNGGEFEMAAADRLRHAVALDQHPSAGLARARSRPRALSARIA